MNPEPLIFFADAHRWVVSVEESETQVVISMEPDAPSAAIGDADFARFISPILRKYEDSKKSILLGNKARGWGLVKGREAIINLKKPNPALD